MHCWKPCCLVNQWANSPAFLATFLTLFAFYLEIFIFWKISFQFHHHTRELIKTMFQGLWKKFLLLVEKGGEYCSLNSSTLKKKLEKKTFHSWQRKGVPFMDRVKKKLSRTTSCNCKVPQPLHLTLWGVSSLPLKDIQYTAFLLSFIYSFSSKKLNLFHEDSSWASALYCCIWQPFHLEILKLVQLHCRLELFVCECELQFFRKKET